MPCTPRTKQRRGLVFPNGQGKIRSVRLGKRVSQRGCEVQNQETKARFSSSFKIRLKVVRAEKSKHLRSQSGRLSLIQIWMENVFQRRVLFVNERHLRRNPSELEEYRACISSAREDEKWGPILRALTQVSDKSSIPSCTPQILASQSLSGPPIIQTREISLASPRHQAYESGFLALAFLSFFSVQDSTERKA